MTESEPPPGTPTSPITAEAPSTTATTLVSMANGHALSAVVGESTLIDDGSGPPVEDDEDLLDDYPSDTEELDLIHLRILSIPALGLGRFRQIQVTSSFHFVLIDSLT
jgi:hypothetical protein